ncbi:glycoside hydrolase family 16 protein [Nocardioides antri]|uniref:Glycoside hydrolase family 16 protein n=1 Tax=Nocardioides antri TaxID=2607659 RepID=A0A5B1M6L0_9ACTN|nr:glycoside hydrolase family 16 protein [Nocardioides antri]KAA1428895.1 glycoside hydrolase family 16 protein [Nocardioides antri]
MLLRDRDVRRLLAGFALVAAAGLAPFETVATEGAAATSATALSDACGPALTKPDGSRWSCTFVDNFGGNALNPDRWVVQETARTGFRTGRTCYTASSRNVSVRDGELHLVADEGRWFTCRNPLRNFATRYTGGMVGTRGHFSQTFGRFEVRARYPGARTSGLHGGFWMYPLSHKYGAWPASGEIDVAEWWSSDPTLVLPSLHYTGRDHNHDSGWGCRVPDVSNYHTYAVEWLRTTMRFLIDDQRCFSRSWTPDSPLVAPQPFDHPFSMILNMGVGTSTGTNKVTSRTQFPGRYVVQYAKAWR